MKTLPEIGLNPKNETLANGHTLQRKELRVAKKRVIGRYPKAFRKMAVERLKRCDNIVALSQELGVHRRLLYKWRDQLEPIEDGEGPPANSRERELRQQVTQLKRVVADKTLEADFFKGALQKIEARRRSRSNSGETASTSRSEK
jgi:transposase-like protein